VFAQVSLPGPSQGARAPAELPQLYRAQGAVKGWVEGSLLALDVPIRSQFDGTEYQASNCGPTSLAMVLDAFGVDAPTSKLRNLANVLQGTYDRENGIALDYLAAIAREAGLRPLGLRDGTPYRRWSVADVRNEVRQGHPVITLVKMRELPDHAGTRSDTDHYVVVVGWDGDRLLVNDPAQPGDRGFRRPLTPAQLERAWDVSSIPRQAVSIASGPGVPELRFPDPLMPAAAPPVALPEAGMVLPTVPEPPAMVAPEVPMVSAGTGAVLLGLTPGPVPVVVMQVPAVATPTPAPPAARWGRPEVAMPASPPALAQAGGRGGAAVPSRDDTCRAQGVGNWSIPASTEGCDPLVLGQATPDRHDVPWHSLVAIGEVLLSVVVVRRAFR
jgi:uncharacterized protein YvpB